MPELSAEELDRLVRSNRRLMISMIVTLCVIVGAVVILVAADLDFVIRGGAGLGVLIGLLLLIPHRRVIRDLGLTNTEARVILGIEKDRRSGLSAQPPSARARRESIRAGIWLGVGLVSLVAALIALPYFFGKAGETVEENAPSDPWFGTSFFVGFGGLFLGIVGLVAAKNYRKFAADWREQADPAPVEE